MFTGRGISGEEGGNLEREQQQSHLKGALEAPGDRTLNAKVCPADSLTDGALHG